MPDHPLHISTILLFDAASNTVADPPTFALVGFPGADIRRRQRLRPSSAASVARDSYQRHSGDLAFRLPLSFPHPHLAERLFEGRTAVLDRLPPAVKTYRTGVFDGIIRLTAPGALWVGIRPFALRGMGVPAVLQPHSPLRAHLWARPPAGRCDSL